MDRKCENCDKNHDGTFASGRFCCLRCSRSFCTKRGKKERAAKISKSLRVHNYDKVCQLETCGKEFTSPKLTQKFCSRKCAYQDRDPKSFRTTQETLSQAQKKAYRDGRQKVGGGRTKWYKVKTKKGTIKVQGTYEKRAVKILESWLREGKIRDWSYSSVRIPYKDDQGKERTYIVDFEIKDQSGKQKLIEVKGWKRPLDDLKWKAAKDLGYDLEVWFLEDLVNREK